MPTVADGIPWISAVILGAATLAAMGATLAAVRRRRTAADDLPTPRPVDPMSFTHDPDITAALDRRAVRRAGGRPEGE